MKPFIFAVLISTLSFGQECTHLWHHTVEINPTTPKPFSGDAYAVYGLIGYEDVPNLRLQFTGNFPKGRFMSFESYKKRDKNHVDVLYDYQIDPDAGSENPYREGALMEAPNRAYTVNLVKKGFPVVLPNMLKLEPKEKLHSVFYRAYVPSNGQVPTPADLPRIFAFNATTGAPTNCPKFIDTEFEAGWQKLLLHFIAEKKKFDFKIKEGFDKGTNKGIPAYAYGLSKIPTGKVAMVRFKSPTFFDTQSGMGPFKHTGDVRYWSLCMQNLKANETLNCLPDYLAKVDKSGFVVLVVGGDDSVKQAAVQRGFNWLPDARKKDQKVSAFFYRNLLPVKGFPYYQGDYLPTGAVCTAADFIAEKCSL